MYVCIFNGSHGSLWTCNLFHLGCFAGLDFFSPFNPDTFFGTILRDRASIISKFIGKLKWATKPLLDRESLIIRKRNVIFKNRIIYLSILHQMHKSNRLLNFEIRLKAILTINLTYHQSHFLLHVLKICK